MHALRQHAHNQIPLVIDCIGIILFELIGKFPRLFVVPNFHMGQKQNVPPIPAHLTAVKIKTVAVFFNRFLQQLHALYAGGILPEIK